MAAITRPVSSIYAHRIYGDPSKRWQPAFDTAKHEAAITHVCLPFIEQIQLIPVQAVAEPDDFNKQRLRHQLRFEIRRQLRP